jgi:hypothetical protein
LTIEERFQTPEQHMKILADHAMFSDIRKARFDAVDELAERYGMNSIPIIKELIELNTEPLDPFRLHCIKTAEKVFKRMAASEQLENH